MSLLRQIDEFLIEEICAPLARISYERSGQTHLEWAGESLLVGTVLMVAGLFFSAMESPATLFIDAVFSAAIIFFYTRISKDIRNQDWSDRSAAGHREKTYASRCFGVCVLGFFVVSDVIGLLAGRGFTKSDALFDLGFLLWFLSDHFRSSGTPDAWGEETG